MKEAILGIVTLISTAIFPVSQAATPLLSPIPLNREIVLAEHSLDLTTRDEVEIVNEVFAYNILKALEYLGTNHFTLNPGEVFAFHGNVLPEFSNLVVKTMNSHFFIEEGYKAVGGLGGNGVCHLASLMNWTASEARLDSPSSARRARLEVTALANHNFAPVPGVPKEYGTSIRSQSQNQNLYIRNSFAHPVTFVFSADSEEMSLKITK